MTVLDTQHFDPSLEEDFVSCLGQAVIALQVGGSEKYGALTSEAFGLDPGDIADPFFRDCFEKIRKLALADKSFDWRLLRYELVTGGWKYDDWHIRLLDLICDTGIGLPSAIPGLRKRIEAMAHRRRAEGVPIKGRKVRLFEA